MLVPYTWIKEYVEIDDDIKLFADKLSSTGSHVDSILSVADSIENVKVGKVLSIDSHANAQRLVVVKVDVGDREVQIVTGAKNMKVGDYVAVALDGASLPGDVKISSTDFRGELSEGMMCSLKELGYSDSVIPREQRDGILVLNGEFPLGTDIRDALDLREAVIDFEITPNRPDCLSVVGMAREAAATYETTVTLSSLDTEGEVEKIEDYLNGIEIQTPNCFRYIGRVIKDVRIEPSEQWMQNYLMNAGMRPINNIVDITNYVMLEYGQPLHAFDLDCLQDKKVIVRQARPGETIKTLDGNDRVLTEDVMVIADASVPIGLAGVMGGFDSEITPKTKNILIESAVFDMESIRSTSKRLNLRSEASGRYEKGLSLTNAEIASRRVCHLVEQLGAGTVVSGAIDAFTKESPPVCIEMNPDRANALLGSEISPECMIEILELLEFDVKVDEQTGLFHVTVPHFRTDLTYDVDLIEEIGRIYGFENLIPKTIEGSMTRGTKSELRILEEKIKTGLYGLGFSEAISYSFISPKLYDKLVLPEDHPWRNSVRILNPLGEDFSVMRTNLLGNMMEILERNFARRTESLRIYEIGNVFTPAQKGDMPREDLTLCMGMYGSGDFYDLKSACSEILKSVGIQAEFKANRNAAPFHPGRCAEVFVNGQSVGFLGELGYAAMGKYKLGERVYLCHLNLTVLEPHKNLNFLYTAIGKYPSVSRDIAIVIDREIESKTVEDQIRKSGGDLVVDVRLFDVYVGEKIADDKRSLAYNIVFRSNDRTLTDEEVGELHSSIVEALSTELGAELRE